MSVEFTAKSFFPISPEIIETDSRRRMYFGDPRRRGLPTIRFDGAAIESAAVKQTLTETKDSIPDQNIQEDVKKNTKRTCLDYLLKQI